MNKYILILLMPLLLVACKKEEQKDIVAEILNEVYKDDININKENITLKKEVIEYDIKECLEPPKINEGTLSEFFTKWQDYNYVYKDCLIKKGYDEKTLKMLEEKALIIKKKE